MMSYPNGTRFTVELASMRGRPHFKCEKDLLSCSLDTSQLIFVFFFILSFSCDWLNYPLKIGNLLFFLARATCVHKKIQWKQQTVSWNEVEIVVKGSSAVDKVAYIVCHFRLFAKITITCVCMLQSGWNLEQVLGV